MEKLESYWKQQQAEFWEEYRMQRKDGTWMWVLDRGVSIFDEQNRAVRMVGAETDITWRKEAEEALRRQEHEFHTLADNVPDLFSYVDRDRRYRFVNKRYEELFQRPRHQIVGLTMQELLGPEEYAEFLAALNEPPPVSIRLNPFKRVDGRRWTVDGEWWTADRAVSDMPSIVHHLPSIVPWHRDEPAEPKDERFRRVDVGHGEDCVVCRSLPARQDCLPGSV